jgi:hypothetical protein
MPIPSAIGLAAVGTGEGAGSTALAITDGCTEAADPVAEAAVSEPEGGAEKGGADVGLAAAMAIGCVDCGADASVDADCTGCGTGFMTLAAVMDCGF